MARVPTTSIDALLQDSVRQVISRAARDIATEIARLAALELEKQLAIPERAARKLPRLPARRRHPKVEMTKWVADRRARRVPTFVIELTNGLDTKKKIVAKFGENAAFERGKPAPKPKAAA